MLTLIVCQIIRSDWPEGLKYFFLAIKLSQLQLRLIKLSTHNRVMENTIVQAEFPFKGSNNDELCFKKGDLIVLTNRDDGGWWVKDNLTIYIRVSDMREKSCL